MTALSNATAQGRICVDLITAGMLSDDIPFTAGSVISKTGAGTCTAPLSHCQGEGCFLPSAQGGAMGLAAIA
jgi:hypothetical protein